MKIGSLVGKLVGVAAVAGGVGGIAYLSNKEIGKKDKQLSRYKKYYEVANQWLDNKNKGLSMTDVLKKSKYKRIAIYGTGTLGQLFYDEVKNDVDVVYFIDRNSQQGDVCWDDIPKVTIENMTDMESVDVIIVTPVFDYDEIEEALLEARVEAEIVSLDEVVYSV